MPQGVVYQHDSTEYISRNLEYQLLKLLLSRTAISKSKHPGDCQDGRYYTIFSLARVTASVAVRADKPYFTVFCYP